MKQDPDKKVFLTGATGFIGSHVAEYISGHGYRVICGVRKSCNLGFLNTLPVELKYIDLSDADSLAEAMQGASAVIHTAGKVSDWGKWQDFYDANVDGTKNVLIASLLNNIDRIIITGSVSCFGEENYRQLKDEESPQNPRYPYFLDSVWPSGMNYYRMTKSIAIEEAEEFALEHELNLTVIHPVWVYGEREFSSGFYEYMKFVHSGIPFGPGSSKNNFHVIYAGDLARSYLLALEHTGKGLKNYIIGNNPVGKQEEIFSLICREMGRSKPGNLPKALVYPIGLIAELAATLFKMKNPPFLTRARVNLFYDSIGYSTRKAEEELSFKCHYSLQEGIKRTVQWYKDNHLI